MEKIVLCAFCKKHISEDSEPTHEIKKFDWIQFSGNHGRWQTDFKRSGLICHDCGTKINSFIDENLKSEKSE